MINKDSLIKFAKRTLKNKKIIVAIQREPYSHVNTLDGIKLQSTAGGAHVLLDGILKQLGGTMVAIASGNADAKVVDNKNRILVPPGEETYTLKRIFLKKKELDGFYYGFANQTLWPLCHAVFIKPQFSPSWWNEYVKVNQKFADSILEELKDDEEAFLWINDYHLALLPKMIKERKPKVKIGTFWHIPWPTHEIFRICPWRKELLESMLGSDFIGFHRGYHVDNFVECCRRELEVIVDREPHSITHNKNRTKLAAIPAGIDYHYVIESLERNGKTIDRDLLMKDFGINTRYVAIGVDRIDYTKGLIERMKMIDRFLEKYPEYLGHFSYLSIAAPSRVHIPSYKTLNREIADIVEKINWKYSTNEWQPIHYINEVVEREKILSYYRLADIGLVTSLDDGMNLVAKEYVICAQADRGMLILSKFAGAAKDLKASLQINPYSIDGSADAIYQALTMKKDERIKRMSEMKAIIKERNIYDWAMNFIGKTLVTY